MNIHELENILKVYKINKINSISTEDKSLPFMLTTFRELIKNEIPPTQEEFLLTFKQRYPDLKGIVSRLKKAYLSYIREYHLGFLLLKYFDEVIYDEETDILGIDYIIVYKNTKFNIHAFVNTKNGRYWRRIKNKRHTFVGEHIDIPLNLNKGKRVGKFILYTDENIKSLKKKMEKIIETNRI